MTPAAERDFKAWVERIQRVYRSLDSMSTIDAALLSDASGDAVGKLRVLHKDLSTAGTLPVPREERRDTLAGALQVLARRTTELDNAKTPDEMREAARKTSSALLDRVQDVLSRIYEFDSASGDIQARAETAVERAPRSGGGPKFDEATQRKVLEENGWVAVGKVLGEGGGARVFKVVSTQAADRLIEPLLTPMDRSVAVTRARSLAQIIVEFAEGSEPVIAAAKFAKKRDWRTKNEIKVLTEVTHPRLIKPIQVDTSAEPDWYVMPLMPRGSVGGHIATYKGAFGRVLRGVLEIASALEAVHKHGSVHRDVKPANIFLDNSGGWILGDPGIAYVPEADEHTTTRPVSKDWFPRWYGDPFGHDARADVYMLALTMLYMLVGEKALAPSYLSRPKFDLPKLWPDVPGVAAVYDLLKGTIVDEAEDMRASDATAFIALLRPILDLVENGAVMRLQAEVRRLERMLDEPQLVFSFSSTAASSGNDHPGLQFIRIWIPSHAKALLMELDSARILNSEMLPFSIELWDEQRRRTLINSGILSARSPVRVEISEDVAGRWCLLNVRGADWATASVSKVIVHALGGTAQ